MYIKIKINFSVSFNLRVRYELHQRKCVAFCTTWLHFKKFTTKATVSNERRISPQAVTVQWRRYRQRWRISPQAFTVQWRRYRQWRNVPTPAVRKVVCGLVICILFFYNFFINAHVYQQVRRSVGGKEWKHARWRTHYDRTGRMDVRFRASDWRQ